MFGAVAVAAEAGAVACLVADGPEAWAGLVATGVEGWVDVDKFGGGGLHAAEEIEIVAVEDAVRDHEVGLACTG